jgi:electron transfer flavoprotein beta subunit
MKLNIVVLAKQVLDTRNVGPDAMTAEGTVNRGALPAIFNPEDLNALEVALRLKDQNPDTRVTVLTMGPGRAAEVIREAMYRGADGGYLLTDRAFAGADTLATSYALSMAIRHIAPDADLIIGGRQAIDGDTAQVGPQVAEKLGLNQITYVEEVLKCEGGVIRVKRHIDGGVETVESPLPCVLTVNGSAALCRPRNVKLVMKFKRALAPMELPQGSDFADLPYAQEYEAKEYLRLGQLNSLDIDADLSQCGLAGSPTKVKTVENIVFKAKESNVLTTSDEDINTLVKELLESHTIG